MMEEDNDDPAVEKQLLRLLNFVWQIIIKSTI
jgi:hypothetical protein